MNPIPGKVALFMKLLRPCLACLIAMLSTDTAAAAVTVIREWNGTLAIPDNDPAGASRSMDVVMTGTTQILAITVGIEIEGGWNGDLYAYLVHNGRLAMLLNRPGRTAANPFGAGSSGMAVTFSDTAVSDVHLALPNTGTPTGIFQPDGRTSDPLEVLDTDPRTALLSIFEGEDANGTWTLFLADQGAGDTSVLKSWSLEVTVVPEPHALLLIGMGSMFLAFRRPARKATVC